MKSRNTLLGSRLLRGLLIFTIGLSASAASFGAIYKLQDVPAYNWSYGCSPTAAAMMMGYYDRIGYSNMYAGPANGGVAPLTNAVWGSGENPIAASHLGIDGRTTRGSVDDYWIAYNNTSPDPYITNGWTEHTPDSLADFMGTSQSKYVTIQYPYGHPDGTSVYYYYSKETNTVPPHPNPYYGLPLYDYTGCEPYDRDLTHGISLFAESRGYSVLSNYTQIIYGYNGNVLGFTFDNYMAEINAGRPVLIQLTGHTMLGYGYDTASNTVYLHDTWDYLEHTMTWGGSYSGMNQTAVTTFQMASAPVPEPSGLIIMANGAAIFAGILIRKKRTLN